MLSTDVEPVRPTVVPRAGDQRRLAFKDGPVIELGGELIDTDHVAVYEDVHRRLQDALSDTEVR